MDDDKLYMAFRETVKNLNREWLPCDEDDETIAAEIALTEAYGLDRYTVPTGRKKRNKAAIAARTGGIFVSGEGGVPPCRESAKSK